MSADSRAVSSAPYIGALNAFERWNKGNTVEALGMLSARDLFVAGYVAAIPNAAEWSQEDSLIDAAFHRGWESAMNQSNTPEVPSGESDDYVPLPEGES